MINLVNFNSVIKTIFIFFKGRVSFDRCKQKRPDFGSQKSGQPSIRRNGNIAWSWEVPAQHPPPFKVL
ncbi:hypothetical protein A4V04_09340 [Burkholderiales bacterium YL45]|uniref:Uncharacterized protein n=1 Tax=Turicimonas muris TaxID=1796652 RepID=A0A227KHL3_9BURK|nr:hypothetical protein A4V04_09340 [Burkholderiales bacterium YL45]OXE47244.1 hypothetical protein ADH67_08775 [Turicimonas muris]